MRHEVFRALQKISEQAMDGIYCLGSVSQRFGWLELLREKLPTLAPFLAVPEEAKLPVEAHAVPKHRVWWSGYSISRSRVDPELYRAYLSEYLEDLLSKRSLTLFREFKMINGVPARFT